MLLRVLAEWWQALSQAAAPTRRMMEEVEIWVISNETVWLHLIICLFHPGGPFSYRSVLLIRVNFLNFLSLLTLHSPYKIL